jgi:hypothetical protein
MTPSTGDVRNRLKGEAYGLRQLKTPKKERPGAAARVNERAKQRLTGISGDLNWPGNRNPATPFQEDINASRWKDRPNIEREKWMNNSQGRGRADDTGAGTNYKKQAKFGGTQSAGSNKKAQAKISSGTEATGKNFRNQPKFGGTANPQGPNGAKRYANGSGSLDSMRSMIRDH